jgi:uncharacterized membrane protein
MEKINYKREIILWILMLVPAIYIGYVWGQLPERVPIHFDMHGEANDWGSKGMIFLMPAINVGIYFLLLFIPQIDPKKMNIEFFKANFYKIRVAVSLFGFVLSLLLVHLSLMTTPDPHMVKFIPIAALALMTAIGNFMINLKPNWFIGVRTPWTLSSDHVWKQTHLVLGRLWFYGGLICILLAFTVPDTWLPIVILTYSLGSAIFAVAYSFILFKKEQNEKTSHG